MNKILYEHIRNDTNQVFYVGMGNPDRAKSKKNRNKHWHNIVNKSGGYTIRIIETGLTAEEAYELEIDTIAAYAEKGIKLCNKTRGGEGRPDKELITKYPWMYPPEYETVEALRNALPEWWLNAGNRELPDAPPKPAVVTKKKITTPPIPKKEVKRFDGEIRECIYWNGGRVWKLPHAWYKKDANIIN